MAFTFSHRSRRHLAEVHTDLERVMVEAIRTSPLDFAITEGRRSLAEQRALVAAGASQTLKSRHLDGKAVDVAVILGGRTRWDWPLYVKLADHILATAQRMGVALRWGGHWKSFRDGPHFELDRKVYP